MLPHAVSPLKSPQKRASVRSLLRVHPLRGQVNLQALDPSDTHGVKRRQVDARILAAEADIVSLQDRLYAERARSVLIVLQGVDTSGKDGTIRHILRGLNPQGVRVVSFKAPTPTERRHGFLWRIKQQLPKPGEIVIFNRSHYEDVLIAKVRSLASPTTIEERYHLINQFEKDLVARGTVVLKLFLHISTERQRERLLARLGKPDKHWKFSGNDIAERQHWDDYQQAYADALGHCSPPAAPWYVVPSDRKWYRNWAVAQILIETMTAMKLTYPDPHLDVQALQKSLEVKAK
jgi:PPK2 family polyphosphate:nucleotide phosphotransferase